MRRVRYCVAMSLDGYIAGPNGESDWIPMDPDLDFGAVFQQFDTALVGRSTFEAMAAAGRTAMPGIDVIVLSKTLGQKDHSGVIVSGNAQETVAALKKRPGRDIWLFGGGLLFRSLLDMGLVDTVEVSIVPVLLGRGISLLPAAADLTRLKLTKHTVYSKTGIVALEYAVK